VDGLEEQKEYEARKYHFIKITPGIIANTRKIGEAAKQACDAASS
jgi:hypothetical protein